VIFEIARSGGLNFMENADPFREPARKFLESEGYTTFTSGVAIVARAMRISAEETLICYDFGPTLEEVASRISERIGKDGG
jgi:hypothetical protein